MRASGRAARQTLRMWLMRKSGSIVHHDLIFKVVIFFVSHPSQRLLDMQHKSGFQLCRALKHHCKCNVASKWLEAELEGTVAPLPRERERERKKTESTDRSPRAARQDGNTLFVAKQCVSQLF